jgi:hypothetical protein
MKYMSRHGPEKNVCHPVKGKTSNQCIVLLKWYFILAIPLVRPKNNTDSPAGFLHELP